MIDLVFTSLNLITWSDHVSNVVWYTDNNEVGNVSNLLHHFHEETYKKTHEKRMIKIHAAEAMIFWLNVTSMGQARKGTISYISYNASGKRLLLDFQNLLNDPLPSNLTELHSEWQNILHNSFWWLRSKDGHKYSSTWFGCQDSFSIFSGHVWCCSGCG